MKKYDSGMRAVTLVLPAYNEAEQLEDTVNKTIDALKNITDSFEIILAEDGSTDGTDKIAKKLAKSKNIIHLHLILLTQVHLLILAVEKLKAKT